MKKVVIIHPNEILVGDLSPKFQGNLRAGLEHLGVELVLGERVENLGELSFGVSQRQTVKTSKDRSLESDLVFKCTGLRPNTSMTKSIFDESKFDENNRLKVNDFLQIEGLEGVFALGDCCNKTSTAGAAYAGLHAQCIASNVIREIKGQSPQGFKPSFTGAIVPIGVSGGTGVINGWNLPACAVSLAKGKGLFTSKYWAMMGQKQPS